MAVRRAEPIAAAPRPKLAKSPEAVAPVAPIAPVAAIAPPAQVASEAAPSGPEPITLPSDPFAMPAKPEQDLKQRALAGALAADKQVRKESFTQRDKKLVNDETALAAAMGKAYRGGGVKTVEMIAADGSRITKFILPGGGAVCYYAAPNTFSGGRDPFRDSGRVVARSCPG